MICSCANTELSHSAPSSDPVGPILVNREHGIPVQPCVPLFSVLLPVLQHRQVDPVQVDGDIAGKTVVSVFDKKPVIVVVLPDLHNGAQGSAAPFFRPSGKQRLLDQAEDAGQGDEVFMSQAFSFDSIYLIV